VILPIYGLKIDYDTVKLQKVRYDVIKVTSLKRRPKFSILKPLP